MFLSIGLGAVAYVRFRHETEQRAFRRFVIAFVVLIVVVAGLSLASTVREARCPDDANEFCRYNDSVPAIATVVAVYVFVAAIAARVIYAER